ncbi:MAG: hypothetical protein LBE56_10865, partial [Tannerella sp.]|nr:hypothetical protein [Tannerella sp.]
QFDKLPEKEKQAYLRFMDQMNYEKGALAYSKSEGLEQGLERGRAEGRVEGRAEGLAEGKAERDRMEKEIADLQKQLTNLKGKSE